MILKFLSLRRSKRTLRHIHRLYSRKSKSLDASAKEAIAGYLMALQGAILKEDPVESKRIAQELQKSSLHFMPKTTFDRIRDFFGGIFFALCVAVLIRTMWFELYTIPSGSMRPTLKEEDYLIVSKTDYGINVPLQESHFYFDPTLVQRGSIVVFNAANIDMADANTTYFYLFPGKKQLVKRLIGKPGDTLYFYGGQIYGVDAEGKEITDFRNFHNLEHIPMIRFDGKVETAHTPQAGNVFSPVIFHQMNLPLAKLSLNSIGTINGEMIGQRGKAAPAQYSDFLGMKNYAMARLLTKEQVEKLEPNADLTEGLLYLELTHHPSLKGATFKRDEYQRVRPEIATSKSFIPLQQSHLDAIASHMTTCRFGVKKGIAYRLGMDPSIYASHLPRLPGVPDGIYEIQNGKAYQMRFPAIPILGVFTNGLTKELPADHPLYKKSPEQIQLLYNLGFEFLNHYSPTSKSPIAPSRYAYFKNQDLYLLAAPILKKGDPTLENFHKKEEQKRSLSTSVNPYFPFEDNGTPTLEEIRKNGVQVPEKMYLVLGDNHPMSADSRDFGFVPEDNLKGSVSFLFSPPGERWGHPSQPDQPHATLPNITVWSAFILIAIGSSLYYRRKLKAPLKF